MAAGLIILILTFLCMLAAGRLAGRRGRSVSVWLWLAALFGPLAPLAVLVLPDRRIG